MSTPKNARNGMLAGMLAGMVSIAGVVTIWILGASHQARQTEVLSRQWVGEQWDVARTCLLGTPVGRGEPEEAIAARLDVMLVDTLTTLAHASPLPEREATWPTRCVPLFATLRADPSILGGDPSDALTELEVLSPRVLPADGSDVVTAQARARARELAASIARLDAIMPSGAEYDVARFERPDRGVDPALALRSLDCSIPSAAQRPFLGARVGDEELFDELEVDGRSLRLSGALGGASQLATASPDGTETRTLSREDGRHPLLWDASTALWVLSDSARLALRAVDGTEDTAVVIVDEGAAFDRVALCRADAAGHLIAQRGDERSWVRWAGPGEEASPPVALGARPAASGVRMACDDDRLALVWQEGDEPRWTGVLCAADRCEPIPRFEAWGDLQIAVSGEVLVVGRVRRSDLPLARVLTREAAVAWSAPVVAARARLAVTEGTYDLEVCGADGAPSTRVESDDGLRWEARWETR